jgi:hypothetical protein
MAVDDQQILPAVVVVIKKSISETDKRNGGNRDTGALAYIGKETRTVILE